MRDHDVRCALLLRLEQIYGADADTRIVEEMGVWSGSVRIDVAVINGELSGFELKSDSDTLTRLPLQAELYSRVFDRVTLVVGQRHRNHAVNIVPVWWGVTLAIEGAQGNGVQLHQVRQAERNPAIDRYLLAQLLWKEEALELLHSAGASRGLRSRRVKEIHQRLADTFSDAALAGNVRAALKRRQGWLRQLTSDELDVAVDANVNP